MSAPVVIQRAAERGAKGVAMHRLFRVRYTRFGHMRNGQWSEPRIVTVTVTARTADEAKSIVRRTYARGSDYKVYEVRP